MLAIHHIYIYIYIYIRVQAYPDGGESTIEDSGRQRGGEDEASGVTPQHVDQVRGTHDVTTNVTERLPCVCRQVAS